MAKSKASIELDKARDEEFKRWEERTEFVSAEKDELLRVINRPDVILPCDGTMFQSICKTPADLLSFIEKFDDITPFVDDGIVDFIYEDGKTFAEMEVEYFRKMDSGEITDSDEEPDYPNTKETLKKKLMRYDSFSNNREFVLEQVEVQIWSRENLKVLVPEDLFPILATFCFDKDDYRGNILSIKIIHLTPMSDLQSHSIV